MRQGRLESPWERLVGGCVLGKVDYARECLQRAGANPEEQTDDNGRVTLQANSSAIDTIDEENEELVLLKEEEGLIRLFDYFGQSPPSGGAPGRLQFEKIKEGGSDTALKIKVKEWKYEERAVGGHSIYLPKKEICYPSDRDQLILIDPVTIRRVDDAGRLVDVIVSKRTEGSGKLAAGDSFAQTDWRQ